MKTLLTTFGIVGGGILLYKLAQAVTDEEFGGRTFPKDVARQMKRDAAYCCAHCGNRFKSHNLQIDHIVAWANGGRTSMSNGQVLCTGCNLEKSSNNGLLDRLVGRGGRE